MPANSQVITSKEEPLFTDDEVVGPVIDLTTHSDSDDSDVVVIHDSDNDNATADSEPGSQWSGSGPLAGVDVDHDS